MQALPDSSALWPYLPCMHWFFLFCPKPVFVFVLVLLLRLRFALFRITARLNLRGAVRHGLNQAFAQLPMHMGR
jgi:hypothetical protein